MSMVMGCRSPAVGGAGRGRRRTRRSETRRWSRLSSEHGKEGGICLRGRLCRLRSRPPVWR
eukprot:10648589-Alexandrium_andersonii.AAC.1